MFIHIDTLNENITRVVYDYRGDRPGNSVLISDEFRPCGDSLPDSMRSAGAGSCSNRQSEVVLQEISTSLPEKRCSGITWTERLLLNANRQQTARSHTWRISAGNPPVPLLRERSYSMLTKENGSADWASMKTDL